MGWQLHTLLIEAGVCVCCSYHVRFHSRSNLKNKRQVLNYIHHIIFSMFPVFPYIAVPLPRHAPAVQVGDPSSPHQCQAAVKSEAMRGTIYPKRTDSEIRSTVCQRELFVNFWPNFWQMKRHDHTQNLVHICMIMYGLLRVEVVSTYSLTLMIFCIECRSEVQDLVSNISNGESKYWDSSTDVSLTYLKASLGLVNIHASPIFPM